MRVYKNINLLESNKKALILKRKHIVMCPKGMIVCALHENVKRKMPNNMIEICVVNSMDHVMCRRRGSLEEHDE